MRRNDTGRRHAASAEVRIVSEVHRDSHDAMIIMRRNDTGRRHAALAEVRIVSEVHRDRSGRTDRAM